MKGGSGMAGYQRAIRMAICLVSNAVRIFLATGCLLMVFVLMLAGCYHPYSIFFNLLMPLPAIRIECPRGTIEIGIGAGIEFERP
jgi:hypothetical protein